MLNIFSSIVEASQVNKIATWTTENLMKVNEKKTNYMIFSRSKDSFATRMNMNGKTLEKAKSLKILGVWLQEDGGWQKNVEETCKAAYARMSMLTKLSYAGVGRNDLIHLYKMFIRSKLEYCVVPMHNSLTSHQEAQLERCQSVSLRIILKDDYNSYQEALLATGLATLASRRQERCISFAIKCTKHPINTRMFPKNESTINLRQSETFKVNFAHTQSYKNSAIPFCQRLLNERAEIARRRGSEEEE